ncbi:MAG: hypothetical protein EXS36_17515 [Pedosphaera sp.]|nr:hypothetical protein [Pedosphaera sp.]
MDLISIFVPADAIIDNRKAWHKLVRTIWLDVSKAWQVYQEHGQVDIETVYDLVRTTAQSALKGVLSLGTSALEKTATDENVVAGLLGKVSRFGKVAARFVGKGINVFAKVSSGLQVAEYLSGLLLPSSLALERSIIIVGEPFRPILRDFSPRSGRSEDIVVLHGQNFPLNGSPGTISFCQLAGTDPGSVTESVTATILEASADTLTILVTDGLRAVFPNGRAYLCVESPSGRGTSQESQDPYREFILDPLPRPTALVSGPGTVLNRFGRPTRDWLARLNVHGNAGPGIFFDNVGQNTLAYLSVGGNAGDGVLLQGPTCMGNHLDGIASAFKQDRSSTPPSSIFRIWGMAFT